MFSFYFFWRAKEALCNGLQAFFFHTWSFIGHVLFLYHGFLRLVEFDTNHSMAECLLYLFFISFLYRINFFHIVIKDRLLILIRVVLQFWCHFYLSADYFSGLIKSHNFLQWLFVAWISLQILKVFFLNLDFTRIVKGFLEALFHRGFLAFDGHLTGRVELQGLLFIAWLD